MMRYRCFSFIRLAYRKESASGSTQKRLSLGSLRPQEAEFSHSQANCSTVVHRQLCKDWTRRKLRYTATASASNVSEIVPLVGIGEIADVEEIEGIRVLVGEANRPAIEYLIKWKDSGDLTWEPVSNLSDNLIRDFEDKWWKTCREGDEEKMKKMLDHSSAVLPHCVDSNARSGLHFVAAVGQPKCCAMLCQAGADVNLPDKDGYTPLHMAVGYSHIGIVKQLLDAGAAPDIPDNQGRNVVQLVDSIRDSMPFSPQLAGKRLALEEVAALLAGNLYEEVVPKKVLECRSLANGGKEYLIQWMDDQDDAWVKESDMSKDVIQDYEANYEYAMAERLLKMKRRGDQRLYLVKWLDNCENSWEYEDDLSPALITAFETGNYKPLELPQLKNARPSSKRAAKRRRYRRAKVPKEADAISQAQSKASASQSNRHNADDEEVDDLEDGHNYGINIASRREAQLCNGNGNGSPLGKESSQRKMEEKEPVSV